MEPQLISFSQTGQTFEIINRPRVDCSSITNQAKGLKALINILNDLSLQLQKINLEIGIDRDLSEVAASNSEHFH